MFKHPLCIFLLFQEQSAVHSDMENELLVGQETFEECHSSASAFAILKVSTKLHKFISNIFQLLVGTLDKRRARNIFHLCSKKVALKIGNRLL